MNWVGDFAQKHIDSSDSVLDLGCGVMQATMDFVPSYPKTRLKCGNLLGVDFYEPYLDFLRERGIKVLKHNLTNLPLPFSDRSFDVVLLLDILEHLTLCEAEALEREASRIARKKVILLTPTYFFDNEEAVYYDEGVYKNLGANEGQRHKCLLTEKWLRERDYRVERKKYSPRSYFICVKRLNLKILHVWCQAGVAALMATYQRKLGHEADLMKIKEFTAGIEKFYGFGDSLMLISPKETSYGFAKKIMPSIVRKAAKTFLRQVRSFNFMLKAAKKGKDYDIIHIHSLWLLTLFTPFQKKILELHGDDCRSSPSMHPRGKRLLVRVFLRLYTLFNRVYVSTPDLLNDVPNSEWLPNPVDPEHFRRRGEVEPNSALYVHNWYESGLHAKEIASELGLNLTVFDREHPVSQWIPHPDFPAFLSRFQYFIDRKEIDSHSKTGLEALVMGLKVIRGWDRKLVQTLDKKHYPDVVAARTIEIYREKIR